MMNAAQLLSTTDSPGTVHAVSPETTVLDAIKLMAAEGIGALLVLDGGSLAGIFSERDYARKIILADRQSKSTTVGEIMTTSVICARSDQTVDECMRLMTENHIRHLPVLDGEEIAGVLSIRDLLKAVIEEQQFTIEQLEHYITS